MSKDRLGKTLKPSPNGGTKKKHSGYVFIHVKPEARAALKSIANYGDTYTSLILKAVAAYKEGLGEFIAAQNIDHEENENG